MSAIVVDASALAEFLLRTPAAPAVEDELRRASYIAVPALCDVEVTSVVRRALLSRRLDAARARACLDDYRDLPLERHGHLALLDRMLDLRDNVSAYDAAYVALAEHLGATLVTGDHALARALDGLTSAPVSTIAPA